MHVDGVPTGMDNEFILEGPHSQTPLRYYYRYFAVVVHVQDLNHASHLYDTYYLPSHECVTQESTA